MKLLMLFFLFIQVLRADTTALFKIETQELGKQFKPEKKLRIKPDKKLKIIAFKTGKAGAEIQTVVDIAKTVSILLEYYSPEVTGLFYYHFETSEKSTGMTVYQIHKDIVIMDHQREVSLKKFLDEQLYLADSEKMHVKVRFDRIKVGMKKEDVLKIFKGVKHWQEKHEKGAKFSLEFGETIQMWSWQSPRILCGSRVIIDFSKDGIVTKKLFQKDFYGVPYKKGWKTSQELFEEAPVK